MTKKYPLVFLVCSLTFLTTVLSCYLQVHKLLNGTLALLVNHYYNIWFWLILNMGFVFFWRGAWGLLDLVVFPEDLTKSYTLSFLVGIVLLALAVLLGKTEFPV